MKNRNKFIECDGLYHETDTHEWFNDKSLTHYAQKDSGLHSDALPNIFCFNVRNKQTGEYEKVVFENVFKEVVYCSTIGCVQSYVDRLKVEKRFDMSNTRFIARVFEEIDKEDK